MYDIDLHKAIQNVMYTHSCWGPPLIQNETGQS